MFFPAITLLTSLALAAVAGWFSIAGLVTIMAAEPIAALILGITLELGKLVTASWLYRNWHHANWWLKTPLLYFMAALMMTTSMGVFGYLSKAHLEQGSATVDNSARISEIERRIGKEQLKIADNDKMIAQLDNVVDTLIAKEQTNRALAVRRSQAAQRAQLKESTQQIQAEIEKLSEEKFQLGAQLRKLELEVGPIKYIASVIYGDNSNDTLAAAVRLFTLLVVSTLDPLAITLLIAANFTILRLQRERSAGTALPAADGMATGAATLADDAQNTTPLTPSDDTPSSLADLETPTVEQDTIINNVAHDHTAQPSDYDNSLAESATLPVDDDEISNQAIESEELENDSEIICIENTAQAEPVPDSDPPYSGDATDLDTSLSIDDIKEFLNQVCKPIPVSGIITPGVTPVYQSDDTIPQNTSSSTQEDCIMSDTVRELKGRHFIPAQLDHAQIQKAEDLSAAIPRQTARSWISTFKDSL